MRHRIAGVLAAIATVVGYAGIASRSCDAEQLKPQTVQAFENYIRIKEGINDKELREGRIFLQFDALPERERSQVYADLRRGQILVHEEEQRCGPAACAEIPGGLIHDWTGIVFVPGISLTQALAALQDYDRDSAYYGPEVVQSKLLARSGDEFRVFLRLKRVQMITAVFDTEHDIRYANLDATHAYSRSYSTRVVEVENAGEPGERDRPIGDDRGFLWRLYSYWRFYQDDGGVYIQCNAVSLTRDIPTGLGWLVRPYLEKIPAESLRFTLEATRKALATNTNIVSKIHP
jgi:hypothetical protein